MSDEIPLGPFHQIGDEPSAWFNAYRDYPYSVRDICEEVSRPYTVSNFGVRDGVDIEMHTASIGELIEDQRAFYVHHYFDFLARRVNRPARLLILEDPDEFSEDEMADIPAMYRAVYGKGRGNPGYFHEDRDRCDPPLSKFPLLVNIYHAANRWWRTHILPPEFTFFPDFRSIDPTAPDRENLAEVNPSARFFVMLTWAIDPRYSWDEMRKVHDEYYRVLDRSPPAN